MNTNDEWLVRDCIVRARASLRGAYENPNPLNKLRCVSWCLEELALARQVLDNPSETESPYSESVRQGNQGRGGLLSEDK